ncbi:hypothetical protein [Gramella sp. AN32]|uniref:Uncharacterized protein n=1 Tax=Christiangramia antarctica TaxID=2058158 RepID=A0ABW5X0M9_9FLAO|nr:hypothetical protein [Gramella sp. AN32]
MNKTEDEKLLSGSTTKKINPIYAAIVGVIILTFIAVAGVYLGYW